ncbi:hypothetical protein ABVD55_001181 [Vibrio harveyi]
MRRFIVAAQGMSVDAEKQLKDYFQENGLGWWHWIENVWLITSNRDDINATDIHDKIDKSPVNVRVLVIEIDRSKDWTGYGPSTENNNMFEWLRTSWTAGN